MRRLKELEDNQEEMEEKIFKMVTNWLSVQLKPPVDLLHFMTTLDCVVVSWGPISIAPIPCKVR